MTYRILYHHRIRADDGQAVHVRELIGGLRAEGHRVDECALVPKASGESPSSAAADRGGWWSRLLLPRAATEVLEVHYNRVGTARLLAAGEAARPDFVYERHALHCRAGLDAARRLGVPLLLEVNSPMCDEMAELGRLRFAARARRTEREVLAGADHVFAVTEVLRQRLLELGARPERCSVIPNAAQPQRYGADEHAASRAARAQWGFRDDAFVVGFVGYMRSWHRLDLAVEALARPELARACLVLVGDGPAREEALAIAARRGVTERVRALGVVPPELLAAHVCAFDAALIPGINRYASPLKLFDTLAAGVPTLAVDQPNLREVIDDGVDGLLFAQGDVDALAAGLARLVSDPDRAAAIGAAGRAKLIERDWTWRGNARRVAAAFSALEWPASGVPITEETR